MDWEKWEPVARDILIDRVRRGKLSPEEAETEAAKQGFGPLATVPDPLEFDPEQMPWWSLPMALAWIAWRNTQSVREHCAEYRENWLHWIPGSWNVPTNDAAEFERIDGYELKSLRDSTVGRLYFVEAYLDSGRSLPATTQMKVSKAEISYSPRSEPAGSWLLRRMPPAMLSKFRRERVAVPATIRGTPTRCA